jgi:fibronectin type 3 domain-containing protein
MQPFEDALDGYFVYRREVTEKKSNEFKKLTEKPLQANRNRFSDSSAIEGKTYEYAAQSVDLFGGKSDLSAPVRLEINISSPIPPEGVRAQSIKDGVLVKWDETFQKDISGFNLYRYERGKKHEIVATLKSNEMQFIDKKVQKGELYFYYVTCVNSKKIESAPSREVGIRP